LFEEYRVDGAIADAIVERFLAELAAGTPQSGELVAELRRLIDHDLVRREDTLVELYERLAGGTG
jgi:hypothetical protein